jgi:uncharacterized protein YjgD (DUF1641 family)
MAEPILLNHTTRDPREALYRRLETAPKEHAEALLAACDVLQGLHDRGVLELAKGALGSSEKVLQIVVDAGNTPEVIRGIRNVMVLAKILDSIEPELLEEVERAVSKGLTDARTSPAPSWWQLLRQAMGRDSRRALGLATGVLAALGKSVGAARPPKPERTAI